MEIQGKVIFVPKLVLPFGEGLTLWKLIIVRKDAKDVAYTVMHENEHVNQWVQIGLFKFPYLYLKEHFKVGYEMNKYEIEARHAGYRDKHLYEKIV